ncbi:type II toxin-antitoxin system VapB family antitoxin [Salinispora arenicola]
MPQISLGETGSANGPAERPGKHGRPTGAIGVVFGGARPGRAVVCPATRRRQPAGSSSRRTGCPRLPCRCIVPGSHVDCSMGALPCNGVDWRRRWRRQGPARQSRSKLRKQEPTVLAGPPTGNPAQHPCSRDLSQEAVDRIGATAARLGLSRNEYRGRKFAENISPAGERTLSAEDWQRSAEAFADLADPAAMEAAWR